MSNTRRWAAAAAAATAGIAIGVVITAAASWACIAGPTLNLNPGTVKAGGQVNLSGFSYKSDLPIVVRFNALDGPILGTFTPSGGRFGDPEEISGTVTIPAGTKPGSYLLIAIQSAPDGGLAQVPVRALVNVTSAGGAPAVGAPVIQPEVGRPVGPARAESSVSTTALVLVGLGAAGVATLFAGMAAVWLSRRRDMPAVARVTR